MNPIDVMRFSNALNRNVRVSLRIGFTNNPILLGDVNATTDRAFPNHPVGRFSASQKYGASET